MNLNRTLVVHLSDIHFVKGKTGTVYDLDEEVRNELQLDAQRQLRELGRIDAIVVTGDLAFAGRPEEYEFAAEWLTTLAAQLACPPDRIWMVPGNHDVSWDEIDRNLTLRLLHEKLRSHDVSGLNDVLAELVRDSYLCEQLLRPLTAYRAFATRFGCGFDAGKPFWEKDLQLNDGSVLRVRGLTSTLVSNKVDKQGNLVLGLGPATLKRAPGVAHMILCHHPLEWFRERDDLDMRLTSRARLLLFGHKHEQRVRRIDDALLLTAGAVHPYRGEKKWQPRYNYLAVSVAGPITDRRLRIEIHARIWNDESRRFEVEAHSGQLSRQYEFEVEPWTIVHPSEDVAVTPALVLAEPKSDAAVIMTMAAEAVGDRPVELQVMDAALVLAERFWQLPYHIRVRILRGLNLTEENDKALPEEERVRLAFRRARERGLLDQLQEVVQKYTDQRAGGTGAGGVA